MGHHRYIYDLLESFEVDRILGFSDISVDLRISKRFFADFFGFLARCTRL